MPRVQSEDYEQKKLAILDAAADLFSRVGYPSTKLEHVAEACGASKSMLYHYFSNKEDLLFAILTEHLQALIDAFEKLDMDSKDVKKRFRSFVVTYTQKSAQARSRHVVAINDKKYLEKSKLAQIIKLERRLLDWVSDLLRTLNSKLPDETYHAYAMMLIGLLNWTDLWYQPSGPIKPDELCDRISQLFLSGFLKSA